MNRDRLLASLSGVSLALSVVCVVVSVTYAAGARVALADAENRRADEVAQLEKMIRRAASGVPTERRDGAVVDVDGGLAYLVKAYMENQNKAGK